MATELLPGTRLTAPGRTAELVSPLARKRVRVGRDAAVALLAHDLGLRPDLPEPVRARAADAGVVRRAGGDKGTADAVADGVRHWVERGWEPSLDLYLMSRGLSYVDACADLEGGDAARGETVERFLAEEPCPRRAEVAGERLPLPAPAPLARRQLGKVLMERRSVRRYARGATGAQAVSGLLWHGLDTVRGMRRAARSGRPIDLLLSFGVAFDFYLAVYDVDGLDRGLYAYDLEAHALVRLGDLAPDEQVPWFWGMPGPLTAAGTVLLAADFRHFHWRYRHDRALRDLYIEAGRVGQRLIVAAGYAGLGTLVSPATRDAEVNGRLGLDPARRSVVYTLTFGVDARSHHESTREGRHAAPAGELADTGS